ncbi:unnamed protein product [Linum tenue]|uniref:Receptor-like serine/threonine-protein kinase n=1 Tax=Linum tenue TaxID=586396 RepID=A0AAV0QFM3_9ROSI|nr:unnamed protein product [Linum tenue]
MGYVEKKGIFLLSQNSTFGFGFFATLDDHLFVLVVLHIKSSKVVWTANRGLLVSNSDKFVFDSSGNASLHRGGDVVWTSNTGRERVDSMELMESGNLVLHGENESVLWQSFGYPTDTLLPGQEFAEGMNLKSFPNKNNMFNFLQIKSGDLVLYAGYTTPQVYWSLRNDSRRSNRTVAGQVHSASLVGNSWNFYDNKKLLLWQMKFSNNSDPNARWAVILASNGGIAFYNLEAGRSVLPETTKIPQSSCSVPEPCDRYSVCFFEGWCECPASLNSQFGCRPPIPSPCNGSSRGAAEKVDLIHIGEKLEYFALGFSVPMLTRSNLSVCREACLSNCSCLVLFFDQTSGNCFMFDQLGSLNRALDGSLGYTSYMKISTSSLRSNVSGGSGRKEAVVIVIIAVTTLIIVAGLIYSGIWYHFKRKRITGLLNDSSEGDDDFLDNFATMPVRYTLEDLSIATKKFTTKIGQGGFGSVYLGLLPDGTQLAVKKLESVGQGKKEFKAEVSIIGSVHHMNLVKLKGFCAEGFHRLLVYEFMANGSLDRWIFKSPKEGLLLDWNTRFSIALGTAKGLAYLHEECEAKIVHCDIKPQNVLLDENFTAKVSDFGLAKLMNREDSGVYTMVRGTRGYLAPEWISNQPISEKSDVYSYGILLLEIIGGRRNYESEESSHKSHFPSYSFKMFEEGKVRDIIDPNLEINDHEDGSVVDAIKVALWCIQDEMQVRPSMSRVVQMLEGISDVPDPPMPSESCPRPYTNYLRWSSRESTSSGVSNRNYDSSTFVSDSQLSGPR